MKSSLLQIVGIGVTDNRTREAVSAYGSVPVLAVAEVKSLHFSPVYPKKPS